jgi:hypothetical protein
MGSAMGRAVGGFAVALAMAFAGGCVATRPAATATRPAAMAELGFDPPAEVVEWRVGDRVVFEVQVFDGVEERRWYVGCVVARQPDDDEWPADVARRGGLTMSVRPPERAAARAPTRIDVSWDGVYVTLERRDDSYEVLGSTGFALPRPLFERGSYAALRSLQEAAALGPDATISDATRRALAQDAGIVPGTLLAYERMLTRPGIKDLAAEIVRRGVAPSPFSLAFARGYSLETALPERIVSPNKLAWPPAFGVGLAYEATCRLRTLIGEEAICTVRITVVPPRSPLHVCGGVVLVEGWPLRASERWFRIRLVAARRGSGERVRWE